MLQKMNKNRPNNHFIKDATSPYTFTYIQYGVPKSITVNQSANEDTWPGGALWDIGVLMAKLLVMVQSPSSCISSNARSDNKNNKIKGNLLPSPPKRLIEPGIWGTHASWKEKRILELGCGVGLTGLVAASLGARAVLLTDLEVVISQITEPNVLSYLSQTMKKKKMQSTQSNLNTKVLAQTLCWGNKNDEMDIVNTLDLMAPPFTPSKLSSHNRQKKQHRKKATTKKIPSSSENSLNSQNSSPNNDIKNPNRHGIPDIIIIGDVAYQHKPGAPSHFDALLSTTLQFADESTLLFFGTRMRMPASADLLDMFRQHFDEIINPPIEAHEIDSVFESDSLNGRKHNITMHIMRKKIKK